MELKADRRLSDIEFPPAPEDSGVTDVREQAHEEFLKESAGWQVDTSGLPSIRDRQRADAPKKIEKPLAQPYSREYQPRPGALTRSLARMANQIAADKRDPYYRDVLQQLGGARVAYEVRRESTAREAPLSTVSDAQSEEPPPTYADLDELDADGLTRLYHETAKLHAKPSAILKGKANK